jgi:hypothetical protein
MHTGILAIDASQLPVDDSRNHHFLIFSTEAPNNHECNYGAARMILHGCKV